MSDPHDDHILAYYVDLATALVAGRRVRGKNGLPKTEYLSRDTRPSENDARKALVILLGRIRRQLADERLRAVVSILALAFVEDRRDLGEELAQQLPLKLISKKRSTGHSDPTRDHYVAVLVQWLMDSGRSKTRTDAVEKVRKLYGYRDKRQVERIYDRRQKG